MNDLAGHNHIVGSETGGGGVGNFGTRLNFYGSRWEGGGKELCIRLVWGGKPHSAALSDGSEPNPDQFPLLHIRLDEGGWGLDAVVSGFQGFRHHSVGLSDIIINIRRILASRFPYFETEGRNRGLQGDVVYLSWPIAPLVNEPKCVGGEAGGLRGLSRWEQLCTSRDMKPK